MWSDRIIVFAPFLDDYLSFLEGVEYLPVEKLIPEPGDPPPLNWSDLIVRIMKEDRYGEEDIQARGDCFEAASG